MFEDTGIATRLFEGVRSLNFQRYFGNVQEEKERVAVAVTVTVRQEPGDAVRKPGFDAEAAELVRASRTVTAAAATPARSPTP